MTLPTTRLLVSVRDPAEALIALQGGADLIDLKEPSLGALGGLTPADIRVVLAALAAAQPAAGPPVIDAATHHASSADGSDPDVRPRRVRVSATIGDWPMTAVADITAAVAAVDACGVDYVKFGVDPEPDPAAALALIRHLADTPTCRAGRLVPVLIADRRLSTDLVDALLALPIPALLLDTADKRGGSLLDRHGPAALAAHLARVRTRRPDCLAGLAGSLRLNELGQIRELAPGIAGFRGAACGGPREGQIDRACVAALRSGLSG
ncbi:MAG: hypothetical protein RL375_3599 [Pseudomonadota bacterium]|jgi:uncharacterized protein (UPF0264 family)